MADFLRRCELLIGPLAEWQGGGPAANALRIVADGSNSRLRVAFTASKTITGDPNKVEISIYNLAKETRQAIRGNLAKVQLIAGYTSGSDNFGLVASGALMSAVTARENADIVTRLTVFDGYGGMTEGSYSRSFAGGTPVETVVRDLAGSLPGVDPGLISISGELPPKGMQLSGATKDQLNKLADQQGFSWSVQDGVFQAVGDRETTGNTYAFDSRTNLMSCGPLLNGPLQAQVGVEMTAKFEARLKPGDTMVIRSEISPDLNGAYKVTQVDLSFDSHGPAMTKAQSLQVT